MLQSTKSRLVFIGIILIMGMDLIDTTLMNNILPKMAVSFHTTPVHLKLGISIYLIAIGMFLPMSSWLAEKIGYKKTLIFAIGGFALFSMLSGLSQTDTQLFVFRGLQGIFAAFSAPVAALAYLKFSDNMLEGTASLSNYTIILAITGQVIGGIFASLSAESWRLAFFINVPLSLIAITFLYRYYPKESLSNKEKTFDLSGLLLIGSGIAAFFALSEILFRPKIHFSIKILLITVGILTFLTYRLIYKRVKFPIIDFSIFKNKSFSTTFWVNFLSKLTTSWVFFAWPVALFALSHLNTIYISIMSVCLMLGTIVSKRLTKKLIYRYQFKKIIMVGLFLMAIVLTISCVFELHYHYYTFCFMVFCYGFALGMYQTSANAAVYASDSASKLDSINTLKQSSGMLSGAFSLALFSLIYDLFKLYGDYHHWSDIFADAFFHVTYSTAIAQFLLMLWIWWKMKDIKVETTTH
jgi:MFS family permease